MIESFSEVMWVSVAAGAALFWLFLHLSMAGRLVFGLALAGVNAAGWLWGDAGLVGAAVIGAALLSSLGLGAFARPTPRRTNNGDQALDLRQAPESPAWGLGTTLVRVPMPGSLRATVVPRPGTGRKLRTECA